MGLFTKLLDYFNLDNIKERSNHKISINPNDNTIDKEDCTNQATIIQDEFITSDKVFVQEPTINSVKSNEQNNILESSVPKSDVYNDIPAAINNDEHTVDSEKPNNKTTISDISLTEKSNSLENSFIYTKDSSNNTTPTNDENTTINNATPLDEVLCQEVYQNEYEDESDDIVEPYISDRFSIKGLDLFFIDIAREIVNSGTIETIPLMRKYAIDFSRLQNIINEIQKAQIIDKDHKILMSPSELEKFIDIYEPTLFDSVNGSFDKDIFMCIGEIFYEKGIEAVYSCLDADDVVNYLNIFEKLQIIKFDTSNDKFEILMDKDSFLETCKYIPDSFSSSNNVKQEYDSMTGTEFEQYCSSLLVKNGFGNVKTTPHTGNHGIDIFAEKNEITYAIQCKCYSEKVGNSSVHQAYSGKCFYKKDIGVVLTNQFFTEQAKKEASELGIKLWDKNKLDSLIKNATI